MEGQADEAVKAPPASRKATMDDLFADAGGESESKTSKLLNGKLNKGGNKGGGGNHVVIEDFAKQGEFGAKKFIKP